MFSEQLQQKDDAAVKLACGFCGQPAPSKYHTCDGLRKAKMDAERLQRSEQSTTTEEINNAT